MDSGLAWRTGGLMGELSKKGVDAIPVMDEDGYTNQIIVDLGELFGRVRITVEIEE